MDCKRGGFVWIRHNEIRDLEAAMLSEVCKDVSTDHRFNLWQANTINTEQQSPRMMRE